ncbi:MAG: hypothetical protein H6Q17_2717 [Bacteroidetes bacterium]|nr:hypothetical protein [Bacteroidota bacterium]
MKLNPSALFNTFRLSRLKQRTIAVAMLLTSAATLSAATGVFTSRVTGTKIAYKTSEAKAPVRDFAGNYPTVVYLENLGFKKIGRNSNAANVAWLRAQGYRVVELDYRHTPKAVSPAINADIIAINDSIFARSFCGYTDCSLYQSYVLFEGYRIRRNVAYFKDDPTVYNTPAQYTSGDSLRMDIVYPANPSVRVPVILSFSYSNSYATYDPVSGKLTDEHKDQRLKLKFTLAGFNDSFLEGAPANGIAWALADHPKYCPWGEGQPADGPANGYKSYEVNPDAAQKVKSAIRTLRFLGRGLGLSGKIGIFGFSRGSTAGSMAIGDSAVPEFSHAGLYRTVSEKVEAAALGPGVFDYTLLPGEAGRESQRLNTSCTQAWGALSDNRSKWESMGSSFLVKSAATAPVFFFYNSDDESYYHDQIVHLKAKLDSLGVPNTVMSDYGKGHSLPQKADGLSRLYRFFEQYLTPPAITPKR